MHNAKKALAVALAGTMLASSINVAAANELTTQNKLDTLMDLGIIKGDSSNPESLNFNTPMERYRSIVLMLRLTEQENGLTEAEKMESYNYLGKSSFKDAGSFSSYVERLMAYTYNYDLGIDGFEDGTFRPHDNVTDKAFAKMMLESLGYDYGVDFTWDQVEEMAELVGIVEDASDITNEAALFGEMVEMNYNTLAAPVKGEVITLGEKIGKPVVETPEIVDLEVKAVTATNLKQIVVEFTTDVDEDTATDLDNYELDSKTASLTGGSIELIDGTTAVITLGTAAAQQEVSTLTVDGVADVDGNVIDKTEVEISFLDQTIPTVAKAEIVGNKTVKVTFSEPMKTVQKSDFIVKEGSKKVYINSVTAANTEETEFYITLFSDLKEGDLSITTDGSKDYAGFNVIKNTVTVNVEVDEEAPVVVEYKDATPNGVTLVFSEDITIKESALTNYYHTNSKNTATSVTVEGNELKLSFVDNTLPEGTAYVYVNDESVSDLWGNLNDQVMVKIDVEIDVDAPVIEEVEVVSEKQMTIEFDEDLDESIAEDKDNYTLVDSDGEEQSLISKITYASKKITVDFKENLSGDYTLFLEDIEDLSGNKVSGEVDFNVKDLTAPLFTDFVATLYNAGQEDQIIKVAFGEEMTTSGKYSVADEDNYMINSTELSDIEGAYIDVVDNGKAIEIHVPNSSEGGLDVVDTDTLNVARLADAAGNYTKSLSGALDIQPSATVNLDTVEAIDSETIVITFDDKLVDIDSDDIILTTDITDATSAQAGKLAISSLLLDENEDGNTVMTITLATALKGNATTDGTTAVYVYVVGTTSENAYGESLQADENKVVDDKIAAEVDADNSVIVNDTTVDIKFTESLDATANLILVATDLNVTVDGESLVAGIDYTVTITNDILTINLINSNTITDDITVQLDSTVDYLVDTNSNLVETLDITLEK